MKDLIIKKKRDSWEVPNITFNYETGICEIVGESYPENSLEIFNPVMEWLTNYVKERKPIALNFKLYYFNTSSTKSVYLMLNLLKDYQEDGGDVEINWYYEDWDTGLVDEVKFLMEITDLKINLILYDDESMKDLILFREGSAEDVFEGIWL